jgi:hypothetical protein
VGEQITQTGRDPHAAAGRRRAPVWALLALLLAVGLAGARAGNRRGAASYRPTRQSSPFVAEPYLQLGNAPALLAQEQMVIEWITAQNAALNFTAQYRAAGSQNWLPAPAPTFRPINVGNITPQRLYQTTLTGLTPGGQYDYQITETSTSTVFTAGFHARTAASTYRFAVFGCCGAGTPGQAAVAYEVFQEQPDLVFIPGDVVYQHGQASQYLTNYFPVYNADTASAATGGPLIRSTLFLAAIGNRDALDKDLMQYPNPGTIDLDSRPDALAWFFYWNQPLNGPITQAGTNTPTFTGSSQNMTNFIQAAGDAFPQMANFSFDYGNAHWTVIDANPYVNWQDASLQQWVTNDITSSNQTWHFVSFHQVGFGIQKSFVQQWMRILAPLFEQAKVDVVFTAHIHNYERDYPLSFVPKLPIGPAGQLNGTVKLDTKYDGKKNTTPKYPLYVSSGGGGAPLSGHSEQKKPKDWAQYTGLNPPVRYTVTIETTTNTFTLVEVNGTELKFKQISQYGKKIDEFKVTK